MCRTPAGQAKSGVGEHLAHDLADAVGVPAAGRRGADGLEVVGFALADVLDAGFGGAGGRKRAAPRCSCSRGAV